MGSYAVESSTSIFRNHPSAHVCCVKHNPSVFPQSRLFSFELNSSSGAHANLVTIAATPMARNPSTFTDCNIYLRLGTMVVGNG